MTPSKSPSKRKSEGDISGRLCCDAGATDFNGSRVRSVRTSVFGYEEPLMIFGKNRFFGLWTAKWRSDLRHFLHHFLISL
jgi:hypothetical protein